MAKAYLKINVEAGTEREVCEQLRKLHAVTSADLTTGDQDIIAVVVSTSYESLLRTIVEELRKIDGIASTSTSLVLE
jgi:DNA-binding Lrp family transcriptional regulator